MKEYEVTIDGIVHTMLLDEEDAKRYASAKPVKGSRKSASVEVPTPPAAAVTAPASTAVVQSPPAVAPTTDVEPAGNASRDAWVDYATRIKGATPEDLVDADGKELGRDDLRDKYQSPQA